MKTLIWFIEKYYNKFYSNIYSRILISNYIHIYYGYIYNIHIIIRKYIIVPSSRPHLNTLSNICQGFVQQTALCVSMFIYLPSIVLGHQSFIMRWRHHMHQHTTTWSRSPQNRIGRQCPRRKGCSRNSIDADLDLSQE